ncbi:unnamed protein product [Boreogadus saida]
MLSAVLFSIPNRPGMRLEMRGVLPPPLIITTAIIAPTSRRSTLPPTTPQRTSVPSTIVPRTPVLPSNAPRTNTRSTIAPRKTLGTHVSA